jgi:hypothetical protein
MRPVEVSTDSARGRPASHHPWNLYRVLGPGAKRSFDADQWFVDLFRGSAPHPTTAMRKLFPQREAEVRGPIPLESRWRRAGVRDFSFAEAWLLARASWQEGLQLANRRLLAPVAADLRALVAWATQLPDEHQGWLNQETRTAWTTLGRGAGTETVSGEAALKSREPLCIAASLAGTRAFRTVLECRVVPFVVLGDQNGWEDPATEGWALDSSSNQAETLSEVPAPSGLTFLTTLADDLAARTSMRPRDQRHLPVQLRGWTYGRRSSGQDSAAAWSPLTSDGLPQWAGLGWFPGLIFRHGDQQRAAVPTVAWPSSYAWELMSDWWLRLLEDDRLDHRTVVVDVLIATLHVSDMLSPPPLPDPVSGDGEGVLRARVHRLLSGALRPRDVLYTGAHWQAFNRWRCALPLVAGPEYGLPEDIGRLFLQRPRVPVYPGEPRDLNSTLAVCRELTEGLWPIPDELKGRVQRMAASPEDLSGLPTDGPRAETIDQLSRVLSERVAELRAAVWSGSLPPMPAKVPANAGRQGQEE